MGVGPFLSLILGAGAVVLGSVILWPTAVGSLRTREFTLTSAVGRLTQHWPGRLGLLGVTLVAAYAGYKVFHRDISDVMWNVVLVLSVLAFALDVILHRKNIKGLQAALPLLGGSTALLIYFAAQPNSILVWLYRVSGESPGKYDSAFLRVIIGFIAVLLVWQMVQMYRKIAAAKDAGNVKTDAKQGQPR
jgi:hypothetical protein